MLHGPSQLGWNLPFTGLAVFSKTFLRAKSPALNVRGFTCRLCKLANLCWYDAMRTDSASRSSSAVSRYLITASMFVSLGISFQIVGIPISMGMIASIPYMRANGDSPTGFHLVVLCAHNTHDSSSTHFPLAECKRFFKLIGVFC